MNVAVAVETTVTESSVIEMTAVILVPTTAAAVAAVRQDQSQD